LKPSDSRARILERVHRHRRKVWREGMVEALNRLLESLSPPDKDWVLAHAIETGDLPDPILELVERDLDLWEMISGEALESLSKAHRFALQAYEADGARADREAY
jgi:hypothetical protein